MLPLVVLGMVGFTYVFVNQLPGDGRPEDTVTGDTTAGTGDGGTSNTTLPDGTGGTDQPPDGADTTTPPNGSSAYTDAMQALQTELTGFATEMATVNSGWDADPKEINLSDATARLTTLRDGVRDWSGRVAAVEVPADVADPHADLVDIADRIATEAAAVLDGLVNSPGVEARRDAVERFDEAVGAFGDGLAAIAAPAGA
jgi:hypothetical protein